MDNCIFCKIIEGKEEADKVYETEDVLVFPDKNPHAPVHLLIVLKKHVKDVTEVDDPTWTLIKETALRLAKERDLDGFRLVHNAGDAAMIPHLHVHFMAGVTKDRAL